MRKREATAKRYAKALLSLARERGRAEAVGGELDEFSSLLAEHAQLRDALLHPWVKGQARRAVARAVAVRLGCSPLSSDFLGLLAERGRLDHLREIGQAYRQLADDSLGRVRAHVRTAVPLAEPERRQLAERLGRATGKTVLVEAQLDPSLLGGLIAQVGSLVFDGSLDGQLARLRGRLSGDGA